MHLVALALAHVDGEVSRKLAQILFRGSAGDILDAVIGDRPVGLKRVMRCLPGRVLETESYRRLVRLLADPAACKLLHHAGEIDDATIEAIDDVPVALRSVVFAMQVSFRDMETLGDGLRYLVRRGVAANFEDLVADLAHLRQPEQLIAKLRSLAEALPLPEGLPPVQIAQARRIDDAAELRNLAKRWRNCLENYVEAVDGGTCAIYLWEHADIRAACAVSRCARFGWFLTEVNGPRNADIPAPRLEIIRSAFDSAGIPPFSVIRTLVGIVTMAGTRGLGRGPRRQVQVAEQADEDLVLDIG
jgi:hypothetical protein